MSELPPGRAGFLHLVRYLRDPYGATLRLFARYASPTATIDVVPRNTVIGPRGPIELVAEHAPGIRSRGPPTHS